AASPRRPRKPSVSAACSSRRVETGPRQRVAWACRARRSGSACAADAGAPGCCIVAAMSTAMTSPIVARAPERFADVNARPDVARCREIIERLRAFLPAHCLLHRTEDTRPYECDGLSAYRQLPVAVVLP